MIEHLLKLADALDDRGFYIQADEIEELLHKLAQDYDYYFSEEPPGPGWEDTGEKRKLRGPATSPQPAVEMVPMWRKEKGLGQSWLEKGREWLFETEPGKALQEEAGRVQNIMSNKPLAEKIDPAAAEEAGKWVGRL